MIGAIPTMQDDSMLMQDTVTKTASFDTTAYDNGAGFAPGAIGLPACVVVDISVLDKTTGDETYALKMQESDDNATFVDCGVSVTVAAIGVIALKGFLTKRYVRIDGVLAGTTPIITFKAWLNTLFQR